MTEEETITLLKYLSNSFPNQIDFPTGSDQEDQSMVMTWIDWLGRYSIGEVKNAVKTATRKQPDFVPSPARIASEIDKKNQLTPEEAWELAMDVVSEYHPQVNPSPDMSHLPEPLKHTIRQFGVHKLGSLKVDDTYTQHQFKETFEAIQSNHQIRRRQLGKGENEDYSVKDVIKNLSEKMPKLEGSNDQNH